ncbi:MAG: hypothetical protein AAFN17_14555 [Pseudomonadota bacterium]
MTIHIALAALLLLAAPALAATAAAQTAGEGAPLSPEEFGDYATGYTLYFERNGEPWGSESFAEDGSVVWRYPSGNCLEGVWRAYEDQVCFFYGPGTEVLCWSLTQRGEEIHGVLETGDEAGLELMITGRDRRPLLCGEGGSDL